MAVHLMTNTCTIVRKTETKSASSGGLVSTWANLTTGVRCAVQASSSREALAQARETGIAAYDVFFPYGTDVRNSDRLTSVTASGGLSTSAILAVTSNPVDEGGRQAYVVVTAEFVTGEAVT